MRESGWKKDRHLRPEALLKRKRGKKPFGRGFGVSFLVFGDQLFSDFLTRFSRFLQIWPIFRVGENGKNVKNLDQKKPDPRSEFRA